MFLSVNADAKRKCILWLQSLKAVSSANVCHSRMTYESHHKSGDFVSLEFCRIFNWHKIIECVTVWVLRAIIKCDETLRVRVYVCVLIKIQNPSSRCNMNQIMKFHAYIYKRVMFPSPHYFTFVVNNHTFIQNIEWHRGRRWRRQKWV